MTLGANSVVERGGERFFKRSVTVVVPLGTDFDVAAMQRLLSFERETSTHAEPHQAVVGPQLAHPMSLSRGILRARLASAT